MNTVNALKLVRAVEKCLTKAVTDYQGDRVLAFLDALHDAGYEIGPVFQDLSNITVSPAEVAEKMREAQLGTYCGSLPNREESL